MSMTKPINPKRMPNIVNIIVKKRINPMNIKKSPPKTNPALILNPLEIMSQDGDI